MRVTVSVKSNDEALNSLFWWLKDDGPLIHKADVSLTTTARANGHVSMLEVIDVVTTHDTGLASLAVAYAAWRRVSANAPDVTFAANGVSVSAQDASQETVDRLVTALRAARDS